MPTFVTKAIIKQLPSKQSNKYLINIPIFDSAGAPKDSKLSASQMEATLCYQPGNINSYRENDIVYITFEDNDLGRPVIIGKLFLNKEENSTNYSLNQDLEVTNKANLPINTHIGEVSGENLAGYGRRIATLEEIVKELKDRIS